MNPITLSQLARLNWCIETIIADAFELGYDECGSAHQAEKISRPDQEKGG
jgi:hypothetical protein